MTSSSSLVRTDEILAGGRGVRMFSVPGINFAMGIQLYKGGFPIVDGDPIRTYIKVHIKGLPRPPNTPLKEWKDDQVVCQLFYLSSGSNSTLGGVWIPTDVMSLNLSFKTKPFTKKEEEEESRSQEFKVRNTIRKWHWFIRKKPWKSGSGTLAEERFGAYPPIALVSAILGGFRTLGDNRTTTSLEKLQTYVNEAFPSYMEKEGEPGIKLGKEMYDYAKQCSGPIQKFLKSLRHKTSNCDNYDIDKWIETCASYFWFTSFNPNNPTFIPNKKFLDPTSEESIWFETHEGKLILLNNYISNSKSTLLYKESEIGSSDSLLKQAQFRAKVKRRGSLFNASLPQGLKTRRELLERYTNAK